MIRSKCCLNKLRRQPCVLSHLFIIPLTIPFIIIRIEPLACVQQIIGSDQLKPDILWHRLKSGPRGKLVWGVRQERLGGKMLGKEASGTFSVCRQFF
jgi:hypothetical protein